MALFCVVFVCVVCTAIVIYENQFEQHMDLYDDCTCCICIFYTVCSKCVCACVSAHARARVCVCVCYYVFEHFILTFSVCYEIVC